MGNSVATVVAGTAAVLLTIRLMQGEAGAPDALDPYNPPRPTRSYQADESSSHGGYPGNQHP